MGFFIFGKAPTGPLSGFLHLADIEQVIYSFRVFQLHCFTCNVFPWTFFLRENASIDSHHSFLQVNEFESTT